jgi:hypothetical protein
MTAGQFTSRIHNHFDLSSLLTQQGYFYASRTPRPLKKLNSIILPFSSLIWILISVTLAAFGMAFMLAHKIYSSDSLAGCQFHRRVRSRFNFVLFTFCKITEPDPIPWFTRKWSAGKMLTFLWSVFGLVVVLFYSSNLRAHLAAVGYEKRIDTAEDVLQNGKRPWLVRELGSTS